MTEQLSQTEQDVINLDFVKWSAQQLRLKRPTDHNIWKQAKAETEARQANENRMARERRLAAEAEAKTNKQKLDAAELDRTLEPRKEAHKRGWLIANPAYSSTHYEQHVWPLYRQQLIEEQQAAAFEATRQQMAAGYGEATL